MSDAAEFGYPGLAPPLGQQATGNNATKYILYRATHLNNESYIGFSFVRAIATTDGAAQKLRIV